MQLTVKSGLKVIDRWLARQYRTWRHCPVCAKIVHCWRDYSSKVFKSWIDIHGAPDAMTHAKRPPPKAVSGRWGSFSAVEKRLLATEGRLTSVMEAVFGRGQ
eukprot:735260-Pyramimonas_sp.AAC.1